MDCIFCKIVAGEIPCFNVYDAGDVMAFLDINPINKGHTLIIPKKHYKDLLTTPNELSVQLFTAAKKIGTAFKTELGAEGFNLFQNNGECAGQVVGHCHFHVLPRFSSEKNKIIVVNKEEYIDGEAKSLSLKLEEALKTI